MLEIILTAAISFVLGWYMGRIHLMVQDMRRDK